MSHSQRPHLSTPETSDPVRSDDTEEVAFPPPPPPPPVCIRRKQWSEEEHNLFLQGLEQYGRGNWRRIAENCVTSRTSSQIASHAQKYFLRQNVSDRKRRSIHDTTLEIDASSSRNIVTRQRQQQQQQQQDPNPNPNHHSCNQNHSVTRPRQRDPTPPSKNQNHHNRDGSPPPHHLYIDLIIKKSDEGHLDIFVRDSNQVKVQSVTNVHGAPQNSDLSSHHVQIPYFVSTDLPPQHCRVTIKPTATQKGRGVTTDGGLNSENVHGYD